MGTYTTKSVDIFCKFKILLCVIFAAIKHHYETQVSVSRLLYRHLTRIDPIHTLYVTLEKQLLFVIAVIHTVFCRVIMLKLVRCIW